MNKLVSRTVHNTKPVMVEYTMNMASPSFL
ncbi:MULTISPECIES: hypothetical protein [unclassified Chitinophaga]